MPHLGLRLGLGFVEIGGDFWLLEDLTWPEDKERYLIYIGLEGWLWLLGKIRLQFNFEKTNQPDECPDCHAKIPSVDASVCKAK
jgi:hypothetical protein